MMTSLLRRGRPLVLLFGLVAIGSCNGVPTDPLEDSTIAPGQAALQILADVSGTSIAGLVVEVTAADIPEPLIFNIPVTDGVGRGTIRLPAGSDRTITVRALDANGIETHRGSVMIDVVEGTNATVAITLFPLEGDVPIEVTIGSLIVTVEPKEALLHIGETVELTAMVTDADGNSVDRTLTWGSTNPIVATVDDEGVVTARAVGQAEIVANAANVRGSAAITVVVQNMTFTTSGTFTPPVGVTSVRVLLIGGGGGGGGGHQGGGGSGFVAFAECPVSGPVIVTVGVGGAGGATAPDNSNFAGVPGTASSFGACLSANGGSAVTTRNGPAGNGGSGGGGSGNAGNGGAGGSGGSDGTRSSHQAGTGQGDYTGLFANLIRVVPMAGAGGVGGMQSNGGGGGAGGLVIGLSSPAAGDGVDPNGNSGKGGIGYGAGAGGGGLDFDFSSTRWGGGTGAAGVVYIEW